MNTSTPFTGTRLARVGFCISFAIGAITVLGSAAHAAQQTQDITIVGSRVKTIAWDPVVRHPTKEMSVTARVPVDFDSLTLNSGVALLKDDVHQAARRVCTLADPDASPTSDVTMDCIHQAVDNAQPQIDALVARARAGEATR